MAWYCKFYEWIEFENEEVSSEAIRHVDHQ